MDTTILLTVSLGVVSSFLSYKSAVKNTFLQFKTNYRYQVIEDKKEVCSQLIATWLTARNIIVDFLDIYEENVFTELQLKSGAINHQIYREKQSILCKKENELTAKLDNIYSNSLFHLGKFALFCSNPDLVVKVHEFNENFFNASPYWASIDREESNNRLEKFKELGLCLIDLMRKDIESFADKKI